MFTIADIRDIAVQIERNGEKTYRLASRIAADPEVAELLSWMAEEEKKHGQWFENNIISDAPLTEEQRELEQMGRQLLQEMVAGQTFSLDEKELVGAGSLKEMLGLAKGFEKDTILFYEFLKGIVGDEQTEEQLDRIIAEEQKHFEYLQELDESAFSVRLPMV
ncbi:MAG: hypothetical protein CR981_04665 [Proteobacteria bacterium]|nr:MAG: hypothetical protein CR981_04665 [Pseudomonadota bacterium]